MTNAVVHAQRRGRIRDQQAESVLTSFEGLGIALRPATWQQMMPLAVRFDRAAYGAAYLALADMTEQPLITADHRLYIAVNEHLDWVQWLAGYPLV